jgi:hypothetical protein
LFIYYAIAMAVTAAVRLLETQFSQWRPHTAGIR